MSSATFGRSTQNSRAAGSTKVNRAKRGRPNQEESPRHAGTAHLVTDQTDMFRPGQIVPTSGIYRCAGGDRDHVFESTDVKGHRFPPLPAGCSGNGWVLERATGHR
jgi:hypothetical protein